MLYYFCIKLKGKLFLKAISNAIDRFCQKHRGFGIPRLMLYIVVISAGVLVALMASGGGFFTLMAFDPYLILRGQVWRLVTWIFSPVNTNIIWAAIALYFYYFVGSTLEREWGAGKFTIFYVSGILLNAIYGFVMWFVFRMPVGLSPTFLNFSMLFAFATLFPDFTIRLFLIIPIKVKWLALFNAVFFIVSIIQGISTGSLFFALLPVVAVLNYLLMCGHELMSYFRPLKMRSSPQVINYKKAAKQVKRDLADKPYRHKCAVCGRTDTEYPDLEFRYCSRCNGYHCFCIDHINNHIHFE